MLRTTLGLTHVSGLRIFLPLHVVSDSHSSNCQRPVYSSQTTGSLDRTGQDRTSVYTLHRCSAHRGPMHPTKSAQSMHLLLWEGLCREASKASPSSPGPSTMEPQAVSLHVCLLAARLLGKSEQEGAWGLMTSAGRDAAGASAGLTWHGTKSGMG